MKDLRGIEIKAGDLVAHATRSGSSLALTPKKVMVAEENKLHLEWEDNFGPHRSVVTATDGKTHPNLVVVWRTGSPYA